MFSFKFSLKSRFKPSDLNSFTITLNDSGVPDSKLLSPLIEFILAPDSQENPNNINKDTIILVYCAGGYRSALAAKSLLDLGFNNVFNIGGFDEWVNNGGEVQSNSNY